MKRTVTSCALIAMVLLTAPVGYGRQNRSTSMQEGFEPGKLNPSAPPETETLGQLAGVWIAEQITRNRDGSWSDKKTYGEWRWYYILNGHAIQDDWISLPPDDSPSKNPLGYGTNIRIYNPKEKQWLMAWIDTSTRGLAIFTAVNEPGKVIMTGHETNGQRARNTFYNITKDSFDWVKEWTMDEGKTWFPVGRIHCTRKK